MLVNVVTSLRFTLALLAVFDNMWRAAFNGRYASDLQVEHRGRGSGRYGGRWADRKPTVAPYRNTASGSASGSAPGSAYGSAYGSASSSSSSWQMARRPGLLPSDWQDLNTWGQSTWSDSEWDSWTAKWIESADDGQGLGEFIDERLSLNLNPAEPSLRGDKREPSTPPEDHTLVPATPPEEPILLSRQEREAKDSGLNTPPGGSGLNTPPGGWPEAAPSAQPAAQPSSAPSAGPAARPSSATATWGDLIDLVDSPHEEDLRGVFPPAPFTPVELSLAQPIVTGEPTTPPDCSADGDLLMPLLPKAPAQPPPPHLLLQHKKSSLDGLMFEGQLQEAPQEQPQEAPSEIPGPSSAPGLSSGPEGSGFGAYTLLGGMFGEQPEGQFASKAPPASVLPTAKWNLPLPPAIASLRPPPVRPAAAPAPAAPSAAQLQPAPSAAPPQRLPKNESIPQKKAPTVPPQKAPPGAAQGPPQKAPPPPGGYPLPLVALSPPPHLQARTQAVAQPDVAQRAVAQPAAAADPNSAPEELRDPRTVPSLSIMYHFDKRWPKPHPIMNFYVAGLAQPWGPDREVNASSFVALWHEPNVELSVLSGLKRFFPDISTIIAIDCRHFDEHLGQRGSPHLGFHRDLMLSMVSDSQGFGWFLVCREFWAKFNEFMTKKALWASRDKDRFYFFSWTVVFFFVGR